MSSPGERESYERGFASGRRARGKIREQMATTFESWRAGHPTSAHLDYEQELLQLDRDRIGNRPSLARFPETRGWPDRVVAERKGFADGCGCGPAEVAFRYNWFYFSVCRLYTRYLAPSTGAAQCTSVFMRDSREGGPLYGRNCDSAYGPGIDLKPPRRGPDGARRLWYKGVSCWAMCDEEPRETFPIEAWHVLPEDCRELSDVVDFVTRYVEFWCAGNGIIVDEDLNCIAYEKTNCRIGWRSSDNGTAAVTACAQIIPEMKAFRDQCLQRSLEVRDYHDDNLPDRRYWAGAEARYHRLLKLVDEAAARGPALEDMAAIMTDHAVPPPERICLAGESCHPAIPPGAGEWTLRSRAAVLHGPNRRTLFWPVDVPHACYEKPPFLILGDGVSPKPEWQAGTRPPPPVDGPDDELEAYRQYEFDHPDNYPM